MNSKIIKCSSQLRSSGSNTRWKIQLPGNSGQIDNIKAMATRFIQIPNQTTNINENNNTINFYRRRAGDVFDFYSRQIPVGQYTITELLPLLTTALSTVIGGSLVVTATYNTTTNRIELTATGTTFDYIRLTAGPTPGTYTQSPIDPIIGNNTNDIILEGAGAVSLNLPPNLTGISSAHVHSRLISSGNCILPEINISMFDIVDLSNTPYGAVATLDVNHYENHMVSYDKEVPRSYKYIEFVIRDTAGNVLNIPENFDIEIYLRVFY
jgi:hypothetical protein